MNRAIVALRSLLKSPIQFNTIKIPAFSFSDYFKEKELAEERIYINQEESNI